MGISVVNGFLCECACDVAKAKRGLDPHPNRHGGVDAENTRPDGSKRSPLDGPAVTFGGRLRKADPNDPPARDAVAPASAGAATRAGAKIGAVLDMRA